MYIYLMKEKIILFDGVCNLCNKSVQFVIEHDKHNYFKFASLQSNFGQSFLKEKKLDQNNFDSIIYIEDNKYYTKSSAALKIAKHLDKNIFWLNYFIVVPKPIRDFFYSLIANNRYKLFGKQESCWLPTKELKAKFLE